MTFYNTNTNICARSSDENHSTSKEWFEIDEMMIPLITLCNSKGYKTFATCSDHQVSYIVDDNGSNLISDYTGHLSAYIMFKEDYHFNNLPNGWKNEYIDHPLLGKVSVLRSKDILFNNKIINDYSKYYNNMISVIKSLEDLCEYFNNLNVKKIITRKI